MGLAASPGSVGCWNLCPLPRLGYVLLLPLGYPRGGIVILQGSGSRPGAPRRDRRCLSWVHVTKCHPSCLLRASRLKGCFQLSVVSSWWWLLRRQCLCFSGLLQLQERRNPTPTSFNTREIDWFPQEKPGNSWPYCTQEGSGLVLGPWRRCAVSNSLLLLPALFELTWASFLPIGMQPLTAPVRNSSQMRPLSPRASESVPGKAADWPCLSPALSL